MQSLILDATRPRTYTLDEFLINISANSASMADNMLALYDERFNKPDEPLTYPAPAEWKCEYCNKPSAEWNLEDKGGQVNFFVARCPFCWRYVKNVAKDVARREAGS